MRSSPWGVDSDNTYYARVGASWVVLFRVATSPMILRGNVVIAAGSTSGSAAVTFVPPFPGTPTVMVSVAANTTWGANPSAQTATGFQANVFRYSGTGGASVSVNWLAVY